MISVNGMPPPNIEWMNRQRYALVELDFESMMMDVCRVCG